MPRLLVACEESQRACIAFRNIGWEAYSCDLELCSGGHPEWHIQQDVLPLLDGDCSFDTLDGAHHQIIGEWDMIIAHPPCTRLCSSGQRWCTWPGGTREYREQKCKEREDGVDFFMRFTRIKCKRVAIENPVGIMSTRYKPPTQIYNPYDFQGETDAKKTCLWLYGLPKLQSTREAPLPKELRTLNIWTARFGGKTYAWNSPEVAKLRSKTPWGVAKAMAEQWGNLV